MQTLDPNWTVNSASLNSVIQAAESMGADRKSLLESLSINPQRLTEADYRYPLGQLLALYDAAADRTKTPDIGIYSGRISYMNRLNLLLYTLTVCRTFRDYLNLMPSAFRFMGDIGEVLVHREGSMIRLDWMPLWAPSAKQRFLTDEILTGAVAVVNSLCVRPVPLLKAHFSYPKPQEIQLLQTVFACELAFDQPVSCLYYDKACLDYPLTQLYTQWNQNLLPSVGAFFNKSASLDSFVIELKQTLYRLLPTGEVTIDNAAADLNISRRTLQRRLSDRETQFSHELQQVRAELALQYLADERLSITDIAFLLGYSDHGSFSSAFKSWQGQTPRSYRQSLLADTSITNTSITNNE